MTVRRPGQLILVWDPKGWISQLENDLTIRHGIRHAVLKLPQRVRFGDLPSLVVTLGSMLRKMLWPLSGRQGIETGVDLDNPPPMNGAMPVPPTEHEKGLGTAVEHSHDGGKTTHTHAHGGRPHHHHGEEMHAE